MRLISLVRSKTDFGPRQEAFEINKGMLVVLSFRRLSPAEEMRRLVQRSEAASVCSDTVRDLHEVVMSAPEHGDVM